MRGGKAAAFDEDYEAGPDAEEGRPPGNEKPLSSRYRGVCWNRKNRRWQAAINSGGKYVYLGSFLSEYDAARAFDKAAVKLRGTRAKLNFAYSEYVDEHGNLLEDPRMKSIMYKIEAIQGGNIQGTGCAAAGSRDGGGGAATALKSDPGVEDGRILQGETAPLPLPLPTPPSHEDISCVQSVVAPPLPPPNRQLSPLLLGGGEVGGGGGGMQTKQHQQRLGSSNDAKGHTPEWQGARGTGGSSSGGGGGGGGGSGLQHPLQLNLAVSLPGPLPPPQHQHQRPQLQAGSSGEPSALFAPFSETVTTGSSPLPPGGGTAGGGGGVSRGADGGSLGALAAPPIPMAPSVPNGRPMLHPHVPARGRPGPHPTSPLHPMLYAGGLPGPQQQQHGVGCALGPCMPGNVVGGGSGRYDVPPGPAVLLPPGHAAGASAAVAPPPRIPSMAVQRVLLRELSPSVPSVSFLRFVNNRFKENPDDTVGVLYLDPLAPGRVGSAVWNGKCVIRMGMYDTERDACQASIRCMQLNCMFGIDQPSADIFNAMTDLAGPDVVECGGVPPAAQSEYYDAMPPPAPQLQPYGESPVPRGSGGAGGGIVLGDPGLDPPQVHTAQRTHATAAANAAAAHIHHSGGVYGQRASGGSALLSYHGPDDVSAVGMPPPAQHQHQAPSSPRGGGGGGDGRAYGHVLYDPHVSESSGAELQLTNGPKPSNLSSLFQVMKHINGSKAVGDSSNVFVSDSLHTHHHHQHQQQHQQQQQHDDDSAIANGGSLAKRGLHVGDDLQLGDLAHCHKRPGEHKRMRLDPPNLKEFHEAHKIPLAMVLKTWQQQQQQ